MKLPGRTIEVAGLIELMLHRDPAGHTTQLTAPVSLNTVPVPSAVKLPGLHSVGFVDPVVEVPTPQVFVAGHKEVAGSTELSSHTDPAGHGAQLVAPVFLDFPSLSAVKRPSLHSVGSFVPPSGVVPRPQVYFAGHGVVLGSSELTVHINPAGHATQVVAPVFSNVPVPSAVKLPGLHSVGGVSPPSGVVPTPQV